MSAIAQEDKIIAPLAFFLIWLAAFAFMLHMA